MSRRVLALAFAIILTAGYVSVLPSQVAAGPSAAVGSIEESGDLEDGHLINGHGTGLIPSERTLEEREVSLAAGESEMPSSVDLSEEEHFPPVGDQGNQGSCAAWALGYYAQGYLEAKDRGWDASEGRPEHLLSPAWAYNMANRGVDNGSTLEGVGKVIVDWGIPSMAAMPYDQDDHTSWGDQGAFREAPMHRADDVHEIAFDSQVVSSIKDLVSDGVPVTFGIDANQYPNDFDDGNYILSSEEYQSDEVNHAQTIVGYDDAVTDDGEEGAFRVVNSWGTDFAEDGYYWLTYDALEGIGENSMPTYIEDRPDYDPEMLSVWHFDDPPTRDVDIEAGVGDPTAPEDTREPFYNCSEYDELKLPTFMCLDVTSFADDHQAGEEDFFLTVDNASDPRTLSSFRMEAYEGYAPGEADRGSIQSPDVPEEVPATVSTELGLHDPITLEEGLDREVSLRSQGQAEWLGTRDHSVRGGDSVRSGDVGDSGSSGLSLQVEGPASLSFSWKVSSQEDADLLRLRVDGSLQASISGKVDWKRESVDLGPGGHEIEWVYEKDGSISGGADCGWVDALSANSVTVVEEGFEEGFPDDLEAMDEDDGSGEDYWGVSTARSHTGDASLWCAQEGTSSVNGEPNEENGYYDQEMNASLYLSIDLEGYDSAGLSFLHWTETGQGDSLSLWINDGDWDRAWVGENTDGWETVNLSVPTSATELRWVFESDQGVEEHEGSYLDDLMLTGKDTTPPTTSMLVEGEGGDDWYRSEVRVNLSAEDSLSGVDSIQYRIDQGDWRDYDGSFELPEGVHNVQYRVTDAAGNLENGSREIKVDSSSPEAEATVNGESEGHFTSDVEVRIEGSDEISGVDRIMYRLDGGEWSEYSAPIEVGDGEHTLEYRVMDAAGNLETGSAEFTVDTDPLSPSGPYGPLPIIGLVISIAAVIGAAVALRRK